jgi:hypothetical protein
MRNLKALAQEDNAQERGKGTVCKPSKYDIEEKRHGEGIQTQDDDFVFIIRS